MTGILKDLVVVRQIFSDVVYTDGKTNIIFACTQLIHTVLLNDVNEIHADATFKIIPANMGYQLLVLHCMIQNYIRQKKL